LLAEPEGASPSRSDERGHPAIRHHPALARPAIVPALIPIATLVVPALDLDELEPQTAIGASPSLDTTLFVVAAIVSLSAHGFALDHPLHLGG
jgi:hypothetical protein